MIFMEGVIYLTDEIITDILNIELKDLEDFQAIQKDGILYHDFTLKRKNFMSKLLVHSFSNKELMFKKNEQFHIISVIVAFSLYFRELSVR